MPDLQFNIALLKIRRIRALRAIQYVLEQESRLIPANAGLMPVVKGATEKTDPKARNLVEVKPLDTTAARQQTRNSSLPSASTSSAGLHDIATFSIYRLAVPCQLLHDL